MKSKHHFLAILPLLSILSLSPMELDKASHRSIASVDPEVKIEQVKEEKKIVEFPKYAERSAKIDRTKIDIDPELDLDCFSDRGTALRKRIMDERKAFKVDELDKEKIALQKAKIDSLVQSMVEFEVDFAALVEKKAFEEFGQEIASNTIQELKTTIESLLIDDQENDFIALTETPEEPKKEEPTPETPVIADAGSEEPAKEDPKKEEVHECEMTEKNKILTDQVAELLKQQQTILQTMVSMNQMMLQMNQQQQSYNPFANVGVAGPSMYQSMYESSLRFPMSGGTHIYIYGQQPQQQNLFQQSMQQQPQQYAQPMPYAQPQSVPYMQIDPRYSVQPMSVGDFGPANFSFNFGGSNSLNPLPIYSA